MGRGALGRLHEGLRAQAVRASRSNWREIDFDDPRVTSFATFGRSVDLFGDGAIRPLSSRHSKGHMSVLLRLESGRELLLTADAAYARRTIEEELVPVLVDDVRNYRRSLREIRRYLEQTPSAEVICSHDAEGWPDVREKRYAWARNLRRPHRVGRRSMRRFAAVIPLLAVAALLAPAAPTRASSSSPPATAPATLTDVATNQLVARVAVGPGAAARPGSRPTARAADYVAAGNRVLGIDLATRVPVSAATLAGTATGLAVSSDGVRLFAGGRPGAIDVIDAATFTVAGTIALPRSATPTSWAVSTDGSRLAARRRPPSRRDREPRHPTADPARRDHRPERGRLRPGRGRRVGPPPPPAGAGGSCGSTPRASSGRHRVGRGVGGGGLRSPTGRYAVVGTDRGERVTVIFDVRARRPVRRVRTGDGPGFPAWSPDPPRITIADRADGAISVLSGLSLGG